MWKTLATLLLERNQDERAEEVSKRVADPRALVAMRVDKRFDAIVAKSPERFDIDKAQASRETELSELARASPRSLALIKRLVETLTSGRKFDEALALADAAIANAAREPGLYEDTDSKITSIKFQRAQVLWLQGKWKRALQAMESSDPPRADGYFNPDQLINLASYYANLDRPGDALKALAIPFDLSQLGYIQSATVRLRAALEMGDKAAAARALNYLRHFSANYGGQLQWALIEANELDEAASFLVSRLNEPRRRGEALLSIQDFALPASMRRVSKEWFERRNRLLSLPAVEQAITRLGRREHLNILG